MPKRNAPLATRHSALATPYTKYQEWVDAGKPYWIGVSLFNQLGILPQLRMLFNKRENPYNRAKLDSELKTRLSRMPGTRPEERPKRATPATPSVTLSEAKGLPPTPPPADTTLGKLGPDVPPAYTDPKLKAVPFATLPPTLQKGRIDAVAKYRRRTELHDQLGGQYTLVKDAEGNVLGRTWQREPLSGEMAEQCARTIVELSDAINAHFDAERAWAETGALPDTPATLLEELAALTDAQLERRMANQARPAVSRWKKKVTERDGEELVHAQMQLHLAEQEVNAIKALITEREAKRNADADALRDSMKKTFANKKERDKLNKRKRDAAKRAAKKK